MKDSAYYAQVELLIRSLPLIMEDEAFALKGGTAINLFIRDMPRLSVDIDLTFLPVLERSLSVRMINEKMIDAADRLEKAIGQLKTSLIYTKDHICRSMELKSPKCIIKVDMNHVLRGEVRPGSTLPLCNRAQEEFGEFIDVKCLHFDDLYAGKMCAALSRQHPRDLFDIKLLLDIEGITDGLRKAFLVYLVSCNSPISDMLNPTFKDIRQDFESEFYGMNFVEVKYGELEQARRDLVDHIAENITESEKQFLLSLKSGEPDWDLLGLSGIEGLPAIKWKLKNIRGMDKDKRRAAFKKLEETLMRTKS